MFITIKKPSGVDLEYFAQRLKENAALSILQMRLGATELALERTLKTRGYSSLKSACLQLIKDCVVLNGRGDTATIVFSGREHQQLARLISYGNGRYPGSNILSKAFVYQADHKTTAQLLY